MNKDTELVEKIDGLIEELELETQKAISMTKLNVPVKESFTDAMKIMNDISEAFKSISDIMHKQIALSNVIQAFTDFEEKLKQV
jgi:uncharacterized protein with PhoU and TrkA domain